MCVRGAQNMRQFNSPKCLYHTITLVNQLVIKKKFTKTKKRSVSTEVIVVVVVVAEIVAFTAVVYVSESHLFPPPLCRFC